MPCFFHWLCAQELSVVPSVPTTPPQTPLKHPLSSAEIRIVKVLYAVGEGAPMIRQQVLDCHLGLDVSEQLEEAEIYDATARGDTGHLISLAVEKLREGKAEQRLGAS